MADTTTDVATPGSSGPAIVVVAYNRPRCLTRLLTSLARAVFPAEPVRLIISVDDSSPRSLRIAHEFEFAHGPKTVIARETRMGLVSHILACGDLSAEYGSVILLEDDLVVSPHFYRFAALALGFYSADTSVGGVSLYRYSMSESCPAPFEPLQDSSGVHFIQIASSWGQAWTAGQWAGFREWDAARSNPEKEDFLPAYVRGWTGPSWKRRFIAYLIATRKYFVFPSVSLSTNFGDPGTSAVTRGLYQVSLDRQAREHRLVRVEESRSVYDAHFELLPRCLNAWTDTLSAFDYEVDLYGVKESKQLRSEYVLTTRASDRVVRQFGLSMVPNAANVVHEIEGDGIRLVRTADLSGASPPVAALHYQLASVAADIFANAAPPVEEPVPALSIVTLETREAEADASVAAVRELGYPPTQRAERVDQIQHLVLSLKPDSAGPTTHTRRGSVRVTEIPASLWTTDDEMILGALDETTGALMTCLPRNARVAPNALSYVEAIFQAFPGIGWLGSLPPASNGDSFFAMRDKVSRLDLEWGGVFWRRSTWDKAMGKGAVRSRSELWKRMSDVASLHIAMETFVNVSTERPRRRSADDGDGPKSWGQTGEGAAPPVAPAASSASDRRSADQARRFLRSATRPLFEKNVARLRFLHYASALSPYIAIWDSISGSFSFWHYPER